MHGLNNWYKSQSDGVKVAVVAGLSTLFVAIISGAFTLANAELDKSPASNGATVSASAAATRSTSSPNPSEATISAPSPSPTTTICQDKLRITKPAEDSFITSGDNKVLTITGTDCNLGSDSGWLFDYDSDDHYYYDDYTNSTPAPAVQASHGRTWSFPDVAIGDSGDQSKLYTITLVLASPSCAQRLSAAAPIDGEYKWRKFPAGCAVADKVNVYVTYP